MIWMGLCIHSKIGCFQILFAMTLVAQLVSQNSEDLLSLGGKIALDTEAIPLLGEVRAFIIHIRNFNPTRIQLWSEHENDMYTLEWEKRVTPSAKILHFGRIVVELEQDEYIDMKEDYRLGVYQEKDPGPIIYRVNSYPTMVFSANKYRTLPETPVIQSSIEFEELVFPFKFGIDFCNTTGCEAIPDTPQTSMPPVAQNHTTVLKSTFFTDDMQIVFLSWLGALTLLLLILMLYLCCKNKDQSEDSLREQKAFGGNGVVQNGFIMDPRTLPNMNREPQKNVVVVVDDQHTIEYPPAQLY